MAQWRAAILTLALVSASAQAYAALPIVFEQRPGAPADWPWFSRAGGFSVFFGCGEAMFRAPGREDIRIRFGATVAPEPLDLLPSVSNFYLGSDARNWRTGLPQYARIRYRAVYPGIDLLFYGRDGRVEFDFVISPGSDPAVIRLRIESRHKARIDGSDLVIGGRLRLHKPSLYQEIGMSRQSVAGSFTRRRDGISFRTGPYDRQRPLIIDPVLSYSTYLGGSGADTAAAIAVHGSGAAYVTGSTNSTNFPATAGAAQRTKVSALNSDVFVARLNATGTALDFATYLGGSGADAANDVAVDAAGNAYITGSTTGGFPTTPGAYKTSSGAGEVIVAKLSPSGSLLYSTAIGSGTGHGIAAGPAGNVFVTGFTPGSYPVTAGAFQTIPAGQGDAFVTQLNATATGLVYSTLLGSDSQDYGWSIALNASGEATICGSTSALPFSAPAFPTTGTAFQRAPAGGYDAFVARLNATGTALLYATLLGGSDDDFAYAVAVDVQDNAFVTGMTATWPGSSKRFPTTSGAFQSAPGRGFLTKLNAGGTGLVYSTFFGSDASAFCYDPPGRSCGGGLSVAVDGASHAWVTGAAWAWSSIPVTAGAVQAVHGGGADAFLLEFDPAGSAVAYGTLLGGSAEDTASDVALDTLGDAYVTGSTASVNLPVVSGSAWTASAGDRDVYVAKIRMSGEQCTLAISETGRAFPAGGGSGSFSVSTPSGCVWSITAASWVTLDSPATGTGAATVLYTVAPNLAAFSRSGVIDLGSKHLDITQAGLSCTYTLRSTSGAFPAAGGTGQIAVDAPPGCTWSASSPAAWVTLASTSAAVSYTVGRNAAAQPRSLTLSVAGKPFGITQAGDAEVPFGVVDTPADKATGVVGAVAITGWALDNVQVSRVQIWRDAVTGEAPGTRVYIGDATFVDGARPDVAAAYPDAPLHTRAGWGYLLLTNMLPNSLGTSGRGNGPYRLHAIADDGAGNTVTLGTRTITCANSGSVKPFGTIDTPAPGATASGAAYRNWGWALTPLPFSVAVDGTTIRVFVDGKLIGRPTYNLYRSDIATLFPGLANSNGAIGVYIMDTTALSNGLHSIAWAVTDSGGRSEGLGSRLFTVSNPAGVQSARDVPEPSAGIRTDHWAYRQGYGSDTALGAVPVREAQQALRIRRGERLEIHTPDGIRAACLLSSDDCSALPVGSTFDAQTGILYWQADPVFLGNFDFAFEGAGGFRSTLRVSIEAGG